MVPLPRIAPPDCSAFTGEAHATIGLTECGLTSSRTSPPATIAGNTGRSLSIGETRSDLKPMGLSDVRARRSRRSAKVPGEFRVAACIARSWPRSTTVGPCLPVPAGSRANHASSAACRDRWLARRCSEKLHAEPVLSRSAQCAPVTRRALIVVTRETLPAWICRDSWPVV